MKRRCLVIENDGVTANSGTQVVLSLEVIVIIRVFSYTGFPRLRILSCQVVENDGLARVWAPKLCSRSRFERVRVLFTEILPYREDFKALFSNLDLHYPPPL